MTSFDRLLDDALKARESIEPGAYFSKRVMARLRGEVELPPIAFPFWRIAAGLASLAICIIAGLTGDSNPAPFLPGPRAFALIAAAGGSLVIAVATIELRQRRRP